MALGPTNVRLARVVGCACLVASFLIARSALGQDVAGTIEGTVVDDAGAGIAAATIVLAGTPLQNRRTTVSDARGRFQFPLVPVGSYDVRVSLIGHHDATRTEVVVSLGHTTDLGDVRLPLAVVAVAGVEVSAKPERLVTRRSAVGGSLSSRVFRALPSDRTRRDRSGPRLR